MSKRRFRTAAVAALAAFLVVQPDCWAALAAKLGRPRLTARLSSNPAIRRQQLIVDPEGILGGSASVRYDPSVVRLVGFDDPAAFEVTGGFVGVDSTEGGRAPGLAAFADFFKAEKPVDGRGTDPSLVPAETGFVQVFFTRRQGDALRASAVAAAATGDSVIPNLPGYQTVDEDGPTGIADTHALIFEYLPGIADDARATYAAFATPPRTGTAPDFITPADDPANPIPYTEIDGASVTGSLDARGGRTTNGGGVAYPQAVPLPPMAVPALLTLAGAVGLRAWRRQDRGKVVG